jgi:hypothetical protein
MLGMARPKKNGPKNKPFQMRLHWQLRQQLDKLVERNASTLTGEITIAIRKYLQSEGLWPPPKQQQGDVGEE